MNYIDRFDRVEDYNLGDRFSFNIMLAPEVLGGHRDAMLFSGSKSKGYRFGDSAFLRGEIGFATRYQEGGLEDSLVRAEVKYYNVLGEKYLGGVFIGRHTLAFNSFLDYGDKLDLDRQFLVGADNVLRGSKQKTFAGDKRFGINFEDRVHLADDIFHLVSLGAAGFVDIGGASDDKISELLSDDVYSDIGVGLRFAFPRSSGGSVLRIDFAVPMRDGPDGSEAFQVRVIFAGGQLFTSHLRSEDLGAEKANVAIGFDK